jgi:hypothetical protein
MNELDLVERLARLARSKPAPSVDVADKVMRRLKAGAAAEPADMFWPLAAGVSFAAAALLFLAVQSLVASQEPLAELLSAVRTVFP